MASSLPQSVRRCLPPRQSAWRLAGCVPAGLDQTVALSLPDGRVVVARWQPRHRPFGLLGALGLLAMAIALGAYPIVRRITRRLERLQSAG